MAKFATGNAYYYDSASAQHQESMPSHEGDSFSSPVIMRILRILLENGELKKSNLCSKAGLNYKVCTKYVGFLARLRWIEIHENGGQGVRISIPTEGIENLRKLESNDGQFEKQITRSVPVEFSGYSLDEKTSNSKDRPRTVVGKKTIVIIDDDENALATYSAFLENHKNFHILTFSNSKNALEYFTYYPESCDLILLDIRMPGMSGLRLFQALRALSPKTSIIFLSSLDAGPELSELFSDPKLGNKNFLRKPVSRTNFIEAVTRATS